MKPTQATLFAILTTALASPTPTLNKRQSQTQCGQYEVITSTPYLIYTDLWGESSGTGGQCSTLISNNDGDLSWSTNWTWSGGQGQVKSYTNVGLQMQDTQISTIKSIPTTWSYTYTGSNLIADVSYDMFTTSSSGGSNEFEIMVWLDTLGGAGPISSSGSPVATPNIGGTSFKLFSGPNGATTVYSFVAASTVNNFSGDILDFFNYLEQNQGFSKSQYLVNIQAGTEPFSGSNALLKTAKYSVSLET